jgi:hypothetical protein
METQAFTFAASRFVPVAIGFFGLGTGYFVWGGQALFDFPRQARKLTELSEYGDSGCRASCSSSQVST